MENILYLTHGLPYPPDKATHGDQRDRVRAYQQLRYLSRYFRVYLGCLITDPDDWQHVEQVRSLCADSCFVDQIPAMARWRSMAAWIVGESTSLPQYYSGRLQRWVTRALAGRGIERAMAFTAPMAQYLPTASERKLQRVVDFVALGSEQWRADGDRQTWPLSLLYRHEANLLLAYEKALTRQGAAAIFDSRRQADMFRRRAPESGRKLEYFHNGIDSDYFSPAALYRNPYPDGATVLVFTGAMDEPDNIDAVCWFANTVLPALHDSFPALSFHIVGARPAPQIKALAGRVGVVVAGAVPDVRPYLAHAVLAVAPMRAAHGVPSQVLEAMAMQKTVVCSPQALEGIQAEAGIDLLVAQDSKEFVRHVSEMLRGKVNRSLGMAARKRVLSDYCWESNLQRLGSLLGVGHPPVAQPIAPPAIAAPRRPLRQATAA